MFKCEYANKYIPGICIMYKSVNTWKCKYGNMPLLTSNGARTRYELRVQLLRGTIVNRTYGIHKNLHI